MFFVIGHTMMRLETSCISALEMTNAGRDLPVPYRARIEIEDNDVARAIN